MSLRKGSWKPYCNYHLLPSSIGRNPPFFPHVFSQYGMIDWLQELHNDTYHFGELNASR